MKLKTKIKKVTSNLYLKFGRLIGIDIVNVLCVSINEQSQYNKQLRDGIYDALQLIPNSIAEDKVVEILKFALYTPIKKEKEKN